MGTKRATKVQTTDKGGRIRTMAKRGDGWVNELTGLGSTSRDKRTFHSVFGTLLSQEEAEEMWEGDDFAARIVETLPREMTRRGFDLQIQADEMVSPEADRNSEEISGAAGYGVRDRADPAVPPSPARVQPPPPPEPTPEDHAHDHAKELSEELMDQWEELEGDESFFEAMCYARAFGGGAVFVGANDGVKDLSLPLREDRIKSIDYLVALTPRELFPVSWYADPKDKDWGKAAIYRMQQDPEGNAPRALRNMLVHESRIIPFHGIKVSRRRRAMNRGWGWSVLGRVMDTLRDFDMAWQSAFALVPDFAQAVYKMKGLAELISAGPEGVKSIQTRVQQIDLIRSVLRATLIDADSEEFERKATPITGLAELTDRFCNRLAAAAEIPVTMLMGQAPAGLNATGESDIRWFYDRAAGERETRLRRRQNRLLRLLMLAKEGPTGGKEPSQWSIKYPSMWQMTEKEEAEIRKAQAETDQIYLTAQVVTPEEIAMSRFGGDEYSTETRIDVGARKVNAAASVQGMQLQADPEYQAQQKQKEIEAAAKAKGNAGAPPFGGK